MISLFFSAPLPLELEVSPTVKGPKDQCFALADESVTKGIQIAKLCSGGKSDETFGLLGSWLRFSVETIRCFSQRDGLGDQWQCVVGHVAAAWNDLNLAARKLATGDIDEFFRLLKEVGNEIREIKNCL